MERRSHLIERKIRIAPYYRDMGVVLAFGMTAKDLMLVCIRKSGRSKLGWPSNAWSLWSKEKSYFDRIISSYNTSYHMQLVLHLLAKMKKKDFITFVTLGEGSSNQGDFHEGVNFAGVHKLPVIIMV